MKILVPLFFFVHLCAFALDTGQKAPDFTLKSLNSTLQDIHLSDFKQKIVVLEWFNDGCPFVRKHYDSGNMQKLQKKYIKNNIIWLSVISSAAGKQGYLDPKKASPNDLQIKSFATHILLDPEGRVGRLFGAKTTPQLFIMDKNGILVYQGAIDDQPDTDLKSIPIAKNYVAMALDEMIAGKMVSIKSTQSYGCSVKY
jgi:hypothetical protein